MIECFSGTLSWELCPTQGRQPKVLGHSAAVVGDTLYIFGGIHHGVASDALYILNTGKLFLLNLKYSYNYTITVYYVMGQIDYRLNGFNVGQFPLSLMAC